MSAKDDARTLHTLSSPLLEQMQELVWPKNKRSGLTIGRLGFRPPHTHCLLLTVQVTFTKPQCLRLERRRGCGVSMMTRMHVTVTSSCFAQYVCTHKRLWARIWKEVSGWVSPGVTFWSDMLYCNTLTERIGLAQAHTVGQLMVVANGLDLENHGANWLESLAVNQMA